MRKKNKSVSDKNQNGAMLGVASSKMLLFVLYAVQLLFAAAQLCDKLTDDMHNFCDFGGCCWQAPPGPFSPLWVAAQARSGLPSALRTMVSTGSPIATHLGITSLVDTPASPDRLAGKPLGVHLHLQVDRISAINQKAQNFKMQFELQWVWRDCRTLFNCSDPLTVVDGDAAFGRFWQPRWSIPEMEDEEYHMIRKQYSFYGNGLSRLRESHVGTFRCSFDFTDMPSDVQKCKLRIKLPGFSSDQVVLNWLEVTSDKLANSEWKIDQGPSWSTSSTLEKTPQSSYAVQTSFSQLTAEVTLSRDPGYLLNAFVSQIILFYILSYIGLWLDFNAVPARVAAGVIPALTTSNKMNALSSILPPISYSTRLSDFMSLSLYLIVLHFVEYGIFHWAVKTIKSKNEKKKATEDRNAEDGAAVVRAEEPFYSRAVEKLARLIAAYLENTVRTVSPMIYIIGTIVLCAQ